MWEGKGPLTEEEKRLPYAEFYDMETPEPDPELFQVIETSMDPQKALPIERINDLLNPGYLEAERGWCVLPNGCGYVSAMCEMPDVTAEMFNWWFAWHGMADLRYKIWWPWGHYAIYVNEEAQKIIRDPNRPLTEKFQGITHHLAEDIGTGCNEMDISFKKPEELGFDMSRFHEPEVSTVVGGNVVIYAPGKRNAPPVGCNTMCHMVRLRKEGGIEVRSRFWFGYQMVNGKPVKILPDGVKMNGAFPYGLAHHAVEEYTRLSYLLPKVYEKMVDQPF